MAKIAKPQAVLETAKPVRTYGASKKEQFEKSAVVEIEHKIETFLKMDLRVLLRKNSQLQTVGYLMPLGPKGSITESLGGQFDAAFFGADINSKETKEVMKKNGINHWEESYSHSAMHSLTLTGDVEIYATLSKEGEDGKSIIDTDNIVKCVFTPDSQNMYFQGSSEPIGLRRGALNFLVEKKPVEPVVERPLSFIKNALDKAASKTENVKESVRF